jgi:hypothetical protein
LPSPAEPDVAALLPNVEPKFLLSFVEKLRIACLPLASSKGDQDRLNDAFRSLILELQHATPELRARAVDDFWASVAKLPVEDTGRIRQFVKTSVTRVMMGD